MKMISPVSTALLLVAPLCAQAPAPQASVKFVLNAEPSRNGAPPLDTTRIAAALRAFASNQHLEQPTPGGDGWILGADLIARQFSRDCMGAIATLRLSKLLAGKVVQDKSPEVEVLIVARDSEHLSDALGRSLVEKGWTLLADAHVIDSHPVRNLYSIHKPLLEWDGSVLDLPFPMVSVAEQAPMPPYPADAKANRVQGAVVLEITTDTTGNPESVGIVKGPGPLLAYAAAYALTWRFNPVNSNGHPIRARFWMPMDFRLR